MINFLKINFNEKIFKDLLIVLKDIQELNLIKIELNKKSLDELEKILMEFLDKHGNNNQFTDCRT